MPIYKGTNEHTERFTPGEEEVAGILDQTAEEEINHEDHAFSVDEEPLEVGAAVQLLSEALMDPEGNPETGEISEIKGAGCRVKFQKTKRSVYVPHANEEIIKVADAPEEKEEIFPDDDWECECGDVNPGNAMKCKCGNPKDYDVSSVKTAAGKGDKIPEAAVDACVKMISEYYNNPGMILQSCGWDEIIPEEGDDWPTKEVRAFNLHYPKGGDDWVVELKNGKYRPTMEHGTYFGSIKKTAEGGNVNSIISKLLNCSFRDINWDYNGLTSEEKSIVGSEKDFADLKTWVEQQDASVKGSLKKTADKTKNDVYPEEA